MPAGKRKTSGARQRPNEDETRAKMHKLQREHQSVRKERKKTAEMRRDRAPCAV